MVLEISSRPESFCRAGRRWTRTPEQVPLTAFSKEQVSALKAEPKLVVIEKGIKTANDPGEVR
jgi:hypothetical protein